MAALIVAGLAGTSCFGPKYKFSKAAPSQANGVTIELQSAKFYDNRGRISFYVKNDLQQDIAVVENQIGVVGPDGKALYESKGRTVKIKAGSKKRVTISAKSDNKELYKDMKGLALRFDGVWVGNGQRIRVPSMVIGEHGAGQGQPPAQLTAPTIKTKTKKAKKTAVATNTTRPNDPPPPPPNDGGMQEYMGPRSQITNKVKCAALPLKASGVSKAHAKTMDHFVLEELHLAGFEAMGPEDINAIIGFEAMKEAVGCTDASCIAEIGNALGVQYMARGEISVIEKNTIVSLAILDVKRNRSVARANRTGRGGVNIVPRLVGEAVQELVMNGNFAQN